MSGNFNMSFDPKVKQEFADILSDYGLTVPQAFKLFANQVIKTKTVPLSFDWQAHEPKLQEQVLTALHTNEQEQKSGKSVRYTTLDEMMTDLANER